MVIAGLFPYLLGAAVAARFAPSFQTYFFLLGLFGITLALTIVEFFNEYFDFRFGTGKVPQLLGPSRFSISAGVVAFACTLFIAIYIALARGWPILLFSLLGFISAAFYEAPPFRWSYIGLGEPIICLAYGPFLTMGSYYIHAQTVDLHVGMASLIPASLILSLVLINEIPDYLSDKMAGRKNLVVRIGRKMTGITCQISLLACYILVSIGLLLGEFPGLTILTFAAAPLGIWWLLTARENLARPNVSIPAIRGAVLHYVMAMSLFTVGYVI